MKIRDRNFMYAVHARHKIDLQAIYYLSEHESARLPEITEYCGKDRANVHKRLKVLVDIGVLSWNEKDLSYKLNGDWQASLILDYLDKKEHLFDNLLEL